VPVSSSAAAGAGAGAGAGGSSGGSGGSSMWQRFVAFSAGVGVASLWFSASLSSDVWHSVSAFKALPVCWRRQDAIATMPFNAICPLAPTLARRRR
jgi:hypothetical protein